MHALLRVALERLRALDLEEGAELAHQTAASSVSAVKKPPPPVETGMVVALDLEVGERPLVVVRHHLDEPGRDRVGVREHLGGDGRARPLEVLGRRAS